MSVAAERPIHCLSFDVEEHFQVSAFWSDERRQQWDQCESRVERNTRLLADLLATHGMKATFFVLGWIAERHPDLVKSLAAQGHEVASHGYGHQLIFNQTPNEFRDDVRRAKNILEDLISQPVAGYRAPSFSIVRSTEWALQVLVEEGYAYDASIFPIVHDRYGIPGASLDCQQLETSSGSIWEIPPSTVEIMGVKLPVAGGGYFRLIPYPILRLFLRKIEREGRPLVMYFHPWEFDPFQPRMQGSWVSKFRHYNNLHKTETRLVSLLNDFKFAPIREVIEPVSRLHNAERES